MCKVEMNRIVHISTAATTVVKNGKGSLHEIIVTGGTAGTITVYDNTSAAGTKIAEFDSTNALASYRFNCVFENGLTIVTSAATKLSVVYQ